MEEEIIKDPIWVSMYSPIWTPYDLPHIKSYAISYVKSSHLKSCMNNFINGVWSRKNWYSYTHAGFKMGWLDIGNRVGIDVQQVIGRSYRWLHQNSYRILYHFLSHLQNRKFGQEPTQVYNRFPTQVLM